jgi:methylglutaconyl-CoA hydratase
MTTSTLDVRRDGHVARVYLNRPDVRNAFNEGVIAELTQTFAGLGADASLRCIVLGGHGKAFCAGADLNWMRAMAGYSWDENRADAQALADMLWTIYSCPVPVVGRIHGDCYAGGLGLAAVCDVLVAAEGVNFCLSEAKLGLLPATIGPYVVRAMGEQAARRWFITAERFDAAQARAMGFVHEVCASELLDAKVDELVATLVANGPMAVRACKQLVQDVGGRPIDAELRADTARRIADIRASAEGREGSVLPGKRRRPGRAEARPAATRRHRGRRMAGRRLRLYPWCSSPARPAIRLGRCRRTALLQHPAMLGASFMLFGRVRRRQGAGRGQPVGCGAHLHPRARRRGPGRGRVQRLRRRRCLRSLVPGGGADRRHAGRHRPHRQEHHARRGQHLARAVFQHRPVAAG